MGAAHDVFQIRFDIQTRFQDYSFIEDAWVIICH